MSPDWVNRPLAWAVVAVLVASLACVVAVGMAGATPDSLQAQADGPQLDSGDRINDTAVSLTFVDDDGIATDSIDQSDFILSAGDIDQVSVSGANASAVVTVRLVEPINADELTIAVRNGSDIQDTEGNTIDTTGFVSVTVDGMDAVPPSVRRLDVPERASDEATIRVNFDEDVAAFHGRLSGTRAVDLDRSDFERVRSGQYVLRYEPPEDGVYTFELRNATDSAGNTAQFSRAASMTVKTRTVRAAAGIDLSASEGLNVTFDASGSTDAIEYIWNFDDGDTEAGKRVTHQFAPGDYTVELRVIDRFGNVGRDELVLNLSANGTAGFVPPGVDENESFVSVDPAESDQPTDAQVTVSQMSPEEPVVIRRASDQALVTTADFTLSELTVTPAQSGAFGLGLSAAGANSETLSAARSATGETPVGGFVARPTIASDALSTVTVRFSVRAARLDTIGVGADDVTLYRESNGTWQPQPTSVQSGGDDRISFSAEVPGFSRFAVLAGEDDDTDQSATNDTDNSDTDDDTDDSDTDDDPDDSDTDGSDSDPVDNGTQNGSEAPGGNGTSSNSTQIQVTNITVSDGSVGTGEQFTVDAVVKNQGEEPADYLAALEIDGEVVQTREVLRIPPDGETLPISFTHSINESGTAQVSINGTAGGTVSVGQNSGGGGGLFGFLGFLGFLPLGLLRTLLLFVVAPIAVLFLLLKGVASYLGY
jgi:hypothetical protein